MGSASPALHGASLRAAEVWPDGHVDADLGLNACINQVRVALGDAAEAPRYVETLRGRGYRLIAQVRPARAAGGAAWGRRAALAAAVVAALAAGGVLLRPGGGPGEAPTTPRPPRLAVLPFVALEDADTLAYVREGLAEDVITALAGLDPEALAVIARTSSFRLAAEGLDPLAVAERLDADFVLQGSVRAAGRGHRVAARLLELGSGTYVWSRSFDVSEEELLGLDRPIALGVASAVAPAAAVDTVAERVAGPRVRAAILRARYLLERGTAAAARSALELLADVEPALASMGAADVEAARAYLILGDLAAADAALDRARDANPTTPGIDLQAGRVALYGRADPWEATRHLGRAAAAAPGDARVRHVRAQALAAAGRVAEAAREGERAIALDPVSSAVRGDIGWVFYYAGRFAEARAGCHETLELLPTAGSARPCILLAAALEGTLPAESETLRTLVTSLGASGEEADRLTAAADGGKADTVWRWLLEQGRRSDALQGLDEARLLALLGRRDEAIATLWTVAGGAGARALLWAGVDPVFAGLRADPEFGELLASVGLRPDHGAGGAPPRD